MKKLTFSLVMAFAIGQLQAQDSLDAAGGVASSPSGSLSYSLGQLVNLSASNGSYALSEGVQQAYEITNTLGTDASEELKAQLSVAPNPSTDVLYLQTDDSSGLSYLLQDAQSQNLAEQNISQSKQAIDVGHLPSGLYWLSILKQNKTIKTFKIIKK